MKFSFKTVCSAVAVSGIIFGASAQINLLSNSITFRSNSNAAWSTTHYGDLHLEGGSTGMDWGWLYCNKMYTYGPLITNGPAYFYNGLSVVSGTKDFIQPHPTDTTKVIKYICVEAGEAMTMVRGLSMTSGGSVEIALPEHFGLVTSADAPLTVLLTPENAPVLLYTAKKSKESISVVMKPADFREYGDAQFAWQVSGVRDGYENEKIICNADSLLQGIKDDTPVTEKRAKINERAKKLMEKAKNVSKVKAGK
jgi:hypothetical protein